jgi:streptomycin 6-kinase
MKLPPPFIETICGVHGAAGQRWLQDFDVLIRHCEEVWSLQVLEPFPLSYNFVAPVVFANNAQAVLKLCVPGPDAQREIESLRAFDGNGICKLIEADTQRGILLLEQLLPGDSLKSVPGDGAAISIAAGVIKKMQSRGAVPDLTAPVFPSIAHQSSLDKLQQHLQIESDSLPPTLVRKVETLLPQLCSIIQIHDCCTATCTTRIFCGMKNMVGLRLTPKASLANLNTKLFHS